MGPRPTRRRYLAGLGGLYTGGVLGDGGISRACLEFPNSRTGQNSRFGVPRVQWSRTYGEETVSRVDSVVEADDGSYVFAGRRVSGENDNSDGWLANIDTDGNPRWSRSYGGKGDDWFQSIITTEDSGYLLAGFSESDGNGGRDGWLVKVDGEGAVEWEQTYGGDSEDVVESVSPAPEGGYLFAGATASGDRYGLDAWLVNVDTEGGVRWEETYGDGNDNEAFSVTGTNDGGYVFVGRTFSNDGGLQEAWLVNVDAQGTKRWERTYGGGDFEWVYSVVEASDGGYLLAGSTASSGNGRDDAWLVRTDSEGSPQWERTYGGGDDDVATSVVETSGGGYLLTGYTKSTDSPGNVGWLVKTAVDGSVQWEATFSEGASDLAVSVIETSDGGYLVGGASGGLGSGEIDAWLVKVREVETTAGTQSATTDPEDESETSTGATTTPGGSGSATRTGTATTGGNLTNGRGGEATGQSPGDGLPLSGFGLATVSGALLTLGAVTAWRRRADED